MAVSKTGGTKGKLRGQVGTTIYQVKKNSDGTYTQIVYGKGTRTETTFTPKLQAQRMCTAMVENLMKQLKQIGRMSFESGRNKSQSLNAFGSWNLRLVQNDCKANWYGSQKFVYPTRYNTKKDIQDLGGPYIISSGSLQQNIFDHEIYDYYAGAHWLGARHSTDQLYGVQFNCQIGVTKVGEFLKAHRMTRMDKVGIAGFRSWISYDPDPEDPQEYMKHSWCIASMAYTIQDNEIMTEQLIRDLFVLESDISPVILMARDGQSFFIGFDADFEASDEMFYYMATFSLSYVRGKKMISSSQYHNPDGGDDPWWLNQQPANVFGSWMGEPSVRPYPSPF